MSKICDDLRAAILQAAMQGKLTEQLPEDGNAEDLLERVRAKKKKLIPKGKAKRRESLAPTTDDKIPFDIPENWVWTSVGELGVMESGFSFKSPTYTKNGIQVVRISDLGEDEILTGNAVYYPEDDSFTKYEIRANSILICLTGSIGKMALVTDNKKRYLNQRVGMYSLYETSILDYLWRILHAQNIKYDWISCKTSTNGNIKNEVVLNTPIPLPPLSEQKRIVEKVDKLVARVADLEQSTNSLESLKKAFPDDIKAALLQYAMQGKLTKQLPEDGDAEDLLEKIRAEKEKLIADGKIKKQKSLAPITNNEVTFEIPKNWVWVRLGDLTALISDGTHKTPRYASEGVPFLSVQNISKGYFDFTKIKYISKEEHAELTKRIRPVPDDILMCRIGTLGKALKNTLNYEFSIFVSLGIIRLVDVRLVDYVIEAINSPVGFNWIQKNKVGGGTHTYKINLSDLPNMPIPLPPLAEQERIVRCLDELMQKVDATETLITGGQNERI